MAVSLVGCIGNNEQKPTDAPTAQPTQKADATDAPVDVATETPTEAPTEAPTEDPSIAANAAFEALDLEIFTKLVTSGTSAYNQYIVNDPGRFGIDPADVSPGWGELTYQDHVESMRWYHEIIRKLDGIDKNALSESNRLGYDAVRRAFEMELLLEDYYYYDEPLVPKNGLHTMLPLEMVCFNLRTADDIEGYMIMIEDMARFIGQIEQFEVEKAEKGLFMTEKALDEVVESCRGIAKKGKKSILITYFEDDVLKKAKEFGFTDEQCEELKARNRTAVLDGILPAYDKLADTLDAHRSDCGAYEGVCYKSDKEMEYFELRTRYEGATMDDFDTVVSMIEQMGQRTYYDLQYAVYYGPDDILEKVDTIDYSFGSVDDNVEWLKSIIRQYYPEMPEYSLKYIEIPEEIAEDFSPAAYLTPAYDDYYDNVMLINPTSETAVDLFTVAHETIPGHMYQFLYMRNKEDMSLAQQILEPTGYAEAWTVFTEYFVSKNCYDIGNYYCMLMNANSTFCNIFLTEYVDVLVNYLGYSEEDVEEYLSNFGMEDAADIFYELAVTCPFLYTPYAVGYSYISAIYDKAAPKSMSDHKEFFKKYLDFGPNCMDMMRDYMK